MLSKPIITATVQDVIIIGFDGTACAAAASALRTSLSGRHFRPETVVEAGQRGNDGQPVEKGEVAAEN